MLNDKIVIVKCCPFCGFPPDIDCGLEDYRTNGTWIWKIKCFNLACHSKPEVSINIRGKQKFDSQVICTKIDMLVVRWNQRYEENVKCRSYGIKICFDDLKSYLERNIKRR